MPPNSLSPLLVSALTLPLLAVGCAVEEPATDLAIDPVVQIGGSCDISGCGTNSGFIKGVYFHEANPFGAESDGVAMIGANLDDGTPVRMHVHENALRAYDPVGGDFYSSWELLDAVMHFSVEGIVYPVRVDLVLPTGFLFWATGGAGALPAVEAYHLVYLDPALPRRGWQNLCPHVPASDDYPWGASALWAAVFEGQRYDAETLTFDNTPLAGPDAWFNIACGGSALLKQLLIRHTDSGEGGPVPNHDDQAAALNAVTANYCGDGKSFTQLGVPLRLRDELGTIPSNHPSSFAGMPKIATWAGDHWAIPGGPTGFVVEAVWTEDGAYCMETSRREQAGVELEDADQVIRDYCDSVDHPLPTCTSLGMGPGGFPGGFPASWTLHGHVLTAFPAANL
jgi:hypothetical protein